MASTQSPVEFCRRKSHPHTLRKDWHFALKQRLEFIGSPNTKVSPSYPTIFQLAYCLKTSVQLEELRTFEKCQLKAHQTVTQIHKLSPFEEVSSTGDCVITFSYMQQTTVALPSGRGVLNQRCWGTALNTRG